MGVQEAGVLPNGLRHDENKGTTNDSQQSSSSRPLEMERSTSVEEALKHLSEERARLAEERTHIEKMWQGMREEAARIDMTWQQMQNIHAKFVDQVLIQPPNVSVESIGGPRCAAFDCR
eukprot:gnl/TRDRNA2_/TRDRNA2_142175_c1_seq1.p1 gnl/TRDRNA2_/TRDRNA2_142175_c1~~gnl/TRDRNA2_/TRDRNA2_142175_c1_seq1.p1  ORF type:complete len:137 (-),score=22.71 gnl/TRDRNA2_/TRDRNA2_142175_c1_seq1:13-369(-)